MSNSVELIGMKGLCYFTYNRMLAMLKSHATANVVRV